MTEVAGPESVPISELDLAAEFPQATREQWQELVAGVLRKSGRLPEDPADFTGAPESKLVTRTYDGIEIQPLYTAEDAPGDAGFPGLPPYVRGARPDGQVSTGWDVRARFAGEDARAVNQAILADLEGGVTSIWLAVPPASLADALNEVYLDLAPVVLDAGADFEAAADALFELFAEREIPASEATAVLGADPIGLAARTGSPADLGPAAALAARVAAKYPKVRTIVADGLPFHEAGGSDAQELGALVAAGVTYLRSLTDAGLDVEAAAGQLEFRIAATADQFSTIAKLRAARRLWARVAEVCGFSAPMRQHAVTSPAMLTRRDPWVNMLRTTVACFGAGVGGADAVTVLPFDAAIGKPDAFSARIARNTHAVLLEESKLAGVIDPAGGSWYVEKLTDELAHAAWAEFTAIEGAGGLAAELASGALAGRLAATWEKRSKRIATRRDPLTGVSEFPNLAEKPVVRTPLEAPVDGGLPRHRYAEGFEALRDARTRTSPSTANGRRSSSPRSARSPRTPRAPASPPTCSRRAGSRPSTRARPTTCRARSARAARRSPASAAPTTPTRRRRPRSRRRSGADYVLLAGKGSYDGVDANVFAGCDALDVLNGLHAKLGVSR